MSLHVYRQILLSKSSFKRLIFTLLKQLNTNLTKAEEGHFRLPASGFRLPASGFRLPASGFRLPVSGFRLQVSVFIAYVLEGLFPKSGLLWDRARHKWEDHFSSNCVI